MAITQDIKKEIFRKAKLNIPLSEPTEQKQKLYDKYRTNYLNKQKLKAEKKEARNKNLIKKDSQNDVQNDGQNDVQNDGQNGIKSDSQNDKKNNGLKGKSGNDNKKGFSNSTLITPLESTTTPVVSITKPLEGESSSEISTRLLEAQKNKAIGDLKRTKEKALLQLGTEQQAIAPQYQSMKSQAATQSMQQARNFGEYLAARGQSTAGLAAQAELSRGTGLTRQLGEISQQQQSAQDALNARKSQITVDFQSQIANAKSAFEIQKIQQQYQNAITAEERAYNEKLISQGQQFQSSEAEKGRIFAAEQDEIARNFSAEQAQIVRDFTKTMTLEEQEFIKSQKAEDRVNALLDLADARAYEATLTAEERAYEEQKTIEQRIFEASQRRLDREAIASESAASVQEEEIKQNQTNNTNVAIDRIRQGLVTETLPARSEYRRTENGGYEIVAVPETTRDKKLTDTEIASGYFVKFLINNSTQMRESYGDSNYEKLLKEATDKAYATADKLGIARETLDY